MFKLFGQALAQVGDYVMVVLHFIGQHPFITAGFVVVYAAAVVAGYRKAGS